MTNIQGLSDTFLEFARDVKSRTFLLTLCNVGIVVANRAYAWGLEWNELLLITGIIAVFVIFEKIKDAIAVEKGTY